MVKERHTTKTRRLSMFHRRLILLGYLAAFMTILLSGQLARLTMVEGAEHRAKAERVLRRTTWLPTVRGSILDRHGRRLAFDAASYDIAVRYDVIIGRWTADEARRRAKQEVGAQWSSLDEDDRAELAKLFEQDAKAVEQRIWSAILDASDLDQASLESARNEVVRRVHRMHAAVMEQHRAREEKQYADGAERFQPFPIAEESAPHVILPNVNTDTAFAFMELADELPKDLLVVRDAGTRQMPWTEADVELPRDTLPRDLRSDTPKVIHVDGVADHILGNVRTKIWASDVERRPFRNPHTNEIDLGGYREKDAVGNAGLERSHEQHLRGTRGMIRERRDTGKRERVDPIPGNNLELTIDIVLQQRIQALMSHEFGLTRVQPWHGNKKLPLGWKFNAAAVVVEVETGEVLAMVTNPTVSAGQEMTTSQWSTRRPDVNRAIQGFYEPGSIVKPLVLVASLMEDELAPSEAIDCKGHFFESQKDVARCWYYRPQYSMGTHGPLQAAEAIGRSCNIFFYTLGDRLGLDRLRNWFTFFGMGQSINVDLEYLNDDGKRTGSGSGYVPNDEMMERIREAGAVRSTRIFMGIGQGPIAWSPLHAANAYATLARGGIIRDATILMDNVRSGNQSQRANDRPIPRQFVDMALEGLRRSVEEPYGTGHHIRYSSGADWEPLIKAEGIRAWAKTGTAQTSPMIIDTDGDGTLSTQHDQVIRDLDHAWYVGLVAPKGSNRPTHAIAVIVEYGGSGGRVAGPIANEIIRALQHEGYLPGGSL